MFKNSDAFSSFSTNDLEESKEFYEKNLGLTVVEEKEVGILILKFSNGARVMIYPKNGQHTPATFTVLNFPVDDIELAVDDLVKKGIQFEQYRGNYMQTNEKGITVAEGTKMAWFKDPAGNFLALMQEK